MSTTDTTPVIYGMGGIKNNAPDHTQIWNCLVCGPADTDDLFIIFEHYDGRRVNIPVSLEDLTNLADMFAHIAANPTPLTTEDLQTWMED